MYPSIDYWRIRWNWVGIASWAWIHVVMGNATDMAEGEDICNVRVKCDCTMKIPECE